MSEFTHFDSQGQAHMVDVSDKAVSHREAEARGRIAMSAKTLEMIAEGGHKKGDVLGIARIAGIQAAKNCANTIPLCHPLMLSSVKVDFEIDRAVNAVNISARCRVSAQTGVEMEALCAVSAAALTIYDMCKAVDRGMVIGDIGLEEKRGGRSGHWRRDEQAGDT